MLYGLSRLLSCARPLRVVKRPALAAALMAAVGLAGCGHGERLAAAPADQLKHARVLGIANGRFFVDEPGAMVQEGLRSVQREASYHRTLGRDLPPASFLALSGGGDDGAFGAGLLVGWGERGDRPSFKLVTGISTGALIAPFAFLGRDYDDALTKVFTTIDQKDILEKRFILAALTHDGLADTAPLYHLISSSR